MPGWKSVCRQEPWKSGILCSNTMCVGLSMQTPETEWNLGLEHATIRDNIIFGSHFGPSGDGFDEARYDAVLEACALERDLAIFEARDLTGKCPECEGRGFDR